MILLSVTKKLLANVLIWREVSKQRKVLRELTDQQLDDIGVSRKEAIQESNRAFWDHSRYLEKEHSNPIFEISSTPNTKGT